MTCVPPLRTRLSLLYTPANQPHRSARRYDDVTFLVSVDRDLLEEIASKHVGMSAIMHGFSGGAHPLRRE